MHGILIPKGTSPRARPVARPVARRPAGQPCRAVPVHHSTSERSERGECFTRTPPTPCRAVPCRARAVPCRAGPSLDERAERARRMLYPHPTNPVPCRAGPSLDERAERARRVLYPHPTNPVPCRAVPCRSITRRASGASEESALPAPHQKANCP
eukprot:gene19605-biopygen4027